MQLTDWLRVEVALLLIGLTKIYFVKNCLGRDQSSFRLSALGAFGFILKKLNRTTPLTDFACIKKLITTQNFVLKVKGKKLIFSH